MFSTKQLSEDQVEAIKKWATEGAQLPDIQAKIREEFKFPVTYMDTRFVILDLGIELVVEKEEEPVVMEIPAEAAVPTGVVNVTMDAIPQPGALVSGKAVFSDGESAVWMLDQTGRPSLVPSTPDYQPSQDDVVEFQTQLREHIRLSGL
jgi:hypothetical protein